MVFWSKFEVMFSNNEIVRLKLKSGDKIHDICSHARCLATKELE